MPELRLHDWLICAIAQLEREHGHARLLLGPARHQALLALATCRGELPDLTGRAIVDIGHDRLAMCQLRAGRVRTRIYRLDA